MDYEKLTIKYRPRVLSDLYGQETAVNIVRGMFNRDKINRTLLISGPFGSGKTTLARLIATYANCQNREPEGDPCGECPTCVQMSRATPNCSDYREMNAADDRGIDAIRLLIDHAKFMPATNFRVFVLDEMHQLTKEASEALLKILEEPPRRAMFILCTTEPYKLTSTMVSRCSALKIQAVPTEMTVKALTRVVTGEDLDESVFSQEFLTKIAIAVGGHPRNAIETLESVINQIAGIKGTAKAKDLDDIVLKAAAEAEVALGGSSDKQAMAFLLSLYRGKFTGALQVVKEVQNYKAFLESVLKFHEATMCWRFSDKLTDKMMYAWNMKLKEMFGEWKTSTLKPEALVAAMGFFVQTSGDFRLYAKDGYYPLFNMASQAVLTFKADS